MENSHKKFMLYIKQKSYTEQNVSHPNKAYSKADVTEVPLYFKYSLCNIP